MPVFKKANNGDLQLVRWEENSNAKAVFRMVYEDIVIYAF
jgi:hypothetical protein